MPYEIATACDVRLGETFKNNPHLNEITIDGQAIGQAMQDIAGLKLVDQSEDKKHQLLFIAVHGDTLQSDKNDTSTTAHGRFVRSKKSLHKIDTISVAVAGVENAILRMPVDESAKIIEAAIKTEVGANTKVIRKLSSILDELLIDKNRIEPAQSVQATAVHELSHAVDATNRNHEKLDKRYRRKIFGKFALLSSTGIVGGIGALEYVTSVTDFESNILTGLIGGLIVGQAVRYGILKPYFNKNRMYQIYLNSPEEQRARQHEELAPVMPTIITIQ